MTMDCVNDVLRNYCDSCHDDNQIQSVATSLFSDRQYLSVQLFRASYFFFLFRICHSDDENYNRTLSEHASWSYLFSTCVW